MGYYSFIYYDIYVYLAHPEYPCARGGLNSLKLFEPFWQILIEHAYTGPQAEQTFLSLGVFGFWPENVTFFWPLKCCRQTFRGLEKARTLSYCLMETKWDILYPLPIRLTKSKSIGVVFRLAVFVWSNTRIYKSNFWPNRE